MVYDKESLGKFLFEGDEEVGFDYPAKIGY
jgi:hypothetical protein